MTGEHLTEIPIVFYRTSGGVEPVRDWLRGLPGDDRQKIGFDLAIVQVGWPVGMPLCRSLGGGLWEMCSSLSSHRIARILFCVHKGRIGVVCARFYQSKKHRRLRRMKLNWPVSG